MRILGTVASSSREVPGAPTIGTATNVPSGRAYNNGRADVTFTAPTFDGGLPITSYTVTSSPGGFTGSGASSPVTVTGLQSNTSYTFTVTATNSSGTGTASAASNSITATTVPQAPTIGTATTGNASATVTYTAGATGGSAITTFTATSSPGSQTGTGASPITVSGLTNGTAYTFTVTATNANGTSTASAASNSVTPAVPSLSAWSNVGSYPAGRGYMASTSGGGYLWSAGGRSSAVQANTDSYRSTDGASWSSTGALPSGRWTFGGAYDGTYFQVFSGLNSSNVDTNTSYYNNGSSWSTGTVVPNSGEAVRGWSIGSAVATNGYWYAVGQREVYYRTGTGAWSTGTQAPARTGTGINGFGAGNTTNNSARSIAYGINENNNIVYSQTTIGGSWSTVATIPYTSSRPFVATTGSYIFVYGGDSPFQTTCYRYNGSSWDVQSSLPANRGNWGGAGSIGNDIFQWSGESSIGVQETTSYKATQN